MVDSNAGGLIPKVGGRLAELPAIRVPRAAVRLRVARKTARLHRLRYVTDAEPGFRRLRRGEHFVYVDEHGRPVRGAATLARIRKLAIPPAYENVWICKDANGHLQATGVDARGRKQYRYHARWRSTRDADKFDRMVVFGARLPALRRCLKRDLALPGLPQVKILALVVSIIDRRLLRVGNEDYARQNGSFGLTTLRGRHVAFSRGHVRLNFMGKSHRRQSVELSDRRIVTILRRCHDLPGQHLFQYVDDAGQPQRIHSGMVNDYLLAAMGPAPDGTGFTAKDFRTWGATLHAIRLCCGTALPDGDAEQRRCISRMCEEVAESLGNTPAVCRKSYIHPWVYEAWSRQLGPPAPPAGAPRRQVERHALRLLKLQRHARSVT